MSERGFTLVELVMVIILLGVVGTMTSRYLVFGGEIYADAKSRQEAVASVRFAVERIRRDLHNAVPSSVRISQDKRCLELVPMVDSGSYLQLPRSAADKDLNTVVMSGKKSKKDDLLWIYAETPADIYANARNRRATIDSVTLLAGDQYQYQFATAPRFAENSPSRRFYTGREPVSYCLKDGSLYRHSGYGWKTDQVIFPSGDVLIAQGIKNNLSIQPLFNYSGSAASRYSQLLLDLRLQTQIGEPLEIYHAFHIANVP